MATISRRSEISAGSLKERIVQRALRNADNNNSFRTVVFDRSDNESMLVCETDDCCC